MPTAAPHLHINPLLDEKALVALHLYLADKLAAQGVNATMAHQEITLFTPKANLLQVLQFLRDDSKCKFTQLMDVCGVDWLGHKAENERFAVVYHLLSLEKNQRIRVTTITGINGKAPSTGPDTRATEPVPTASSLFPAALWYERETWDMYGIPFSGHPDMRRLLTDYDFVGHPLRKDFPLNGYTEVYYDSEQKRVAYKPVDLPQEFRHFDKVSDWRGMTGNTHLADESYNKEDFK